MKKPINSKRRKELQRKRLPNERHGKTQKVTISGTDIYIRTGEYPDGTLGEIFITVAKQGDEMRLLDLTAISMSVGLQYGIPLEVYTRKFKDWHAGTDGVTDDDEFPMAKSIIDYVAKWLEKTYLNKKEKRTLQWAIRRWLKWLKTTKKEERKNKGSAKKKLRASHLNSRPIWVMRSGRLALCLNPRRRKIIVDKTGGRNGPPPIEPEKTIDSLTEADLLEILRLAKMAPLSEASEEGCRRFQELLDVTIPTADDYNQRLCLGPLKPKKGLN